TATTTLSICTLSLHDALPILEHAAGTALFERLPRGVRPTAAGEVLVRRAARILGEVDGALEEVSGVRDRLAGRMVVAGFPTAARSEEHTSELQSRENLVCRLL